MHVSIINYRSGSINDRRRTEERKEEEEEEQQKNTTSQTMTHTTHRRTCFAQPKIRLRPFGPFIQ